MTVADQQAKEQWKFQYGCFCGCHGEMGLLKCNQTNSFLPVPVCVLSDGKQSNFHFKRLSDIFPFCSWLFQSLMKYLFAFIALLCCTTSLYPQAPPTEAILTAFEHRNKQHLLHESAAYSLTSFSPAFLFDTLLPAAEARYKKSPDEWLQIHLLRLRANAASNHRNLDNSKGIRSESVSLTEEAIRLCYLQEDDLLLAETYFDMAELYNLYGRHEEYITMLTKAFEIADKEGHEFFPGILLYDKLAGMCKAAYHIHSYRESINYGKRALAMREKVSGVRNPATEIFVYDLIGFCHKLLLQPDSSILYYRRIQDVLQGMDSSTVFHKLWSAIAAGNIGENLSAKGLTAEAEPLLQQWEWAGRTFGDSSNIALGKNALAANYFRKKEYRKALQNWLYVLDWSRSQKIFTNARSAAEGIASIYQLTNQADSAFFYLRQSKEFSDSLTAFSNRSGLQAVQSKVKLDHLQRSLENAAALLKEEKKSKQFLLASIVLLAIIATLLYNRQRLKAQNRLQGLAQQQREAELEASKSREEIENFVRHLKEKNDLIDSLRDKLSTDSALKARQDILEGLAEYTLITDHEWEQFKTGFSKTYPSFFPAMAARLNQVTPAEERLATLVFLGFNNLQIANTLGISRESVTRARYRLKQMLGLSKNDELEELVAKW
jgi:tetratricopeptide (TPR) repeat protein/DNA-binding CsgD family transcriptional regulator